MPRSCFTKGQVRGQARKEAENGSGQELKSRKASRLSYIMVGLCSCSAFEDLGPTTRLLKLEVVFLSFGCPTRLCRHGSSQQHQHVLPGTTWKPWSGLWGKVLSGRRAFGTSRQSTEGCERGQNQTMALSCIVMFAYRLMHNYKGASFRDGDSKCCNALQSPSSQCKQRRRI